MKISQELPTDYRLFMTIDMKSHKLEFLSVNILAIITFIPFLIGLGLMNAQFSFGVRGILFFFACLAVYVIFHELVHALFFKFKNQVKIRYRFHGFAASASAPGFYIPKRRYLIVSLAPFAIFNVIFIVLLFFLSGNGFYFVYILLAVHISGCMGDLYVFFKLIAKPNNILIEDYGVGMRVFKKEEIIDQYEVN